MKYMKQFCIIMGVSFLGEILKYLLPLPVPASIYGLLLMFGALATGILPLKQVEETADFLVAVMPLMFIPAGVGLMVEWEALRGILLPFAVIIAVTTVMVMAVTGKSDPVDDPQGSETDREKGCGKRMKEFISGSLFFGMFVSVLGYEIGLLLKKKWKLAILNPLLISIIMVMLLLLVTGIEYDSYNESAKYLSYLLTPATVCPVRSPVPGTGTAQTQLEGNHSGLRGRGADQPGRRADAGAVI